jgi:hypothetical protein
MGAADITRTSNLPQIPAHRSVSPPASGTNSASRECLVDGLTPILRPTSPHRFARVT